MLNVRRYRPEDAAAVDEIYQRCHGHFALPKLDHCVDTAVVEFDGKIIAFGALHVLLETTLVLDTDAPQRVKVQALKELIRAALLSAGLNGFDEIYCFPDSNTYSNSLQQHFNFEPAQPLLIRKNIING
jgi:hypothetical protein